MAAIQSIVILPPIGIARLGSAVNEETGLPDAMDNFALIDDGTAGRRAMVPAPTLELQVDGQSQAVSIAREVTPPEVQFRNGGNLIRPVAPFFEVWAEFDDDPGQLRPLSKDDVTVESVQWTVSAANRKAHRRTQQEGDVVSVDLTLPTTANERHRLHELNGHVGFFPDGNAIKFGHVVFLQPTSEFPELRLRIYPAHGLIYGHQTTLVVESDEDSRITMEIPRERVVYPPDTHEQARWDKYVGGEDPFRTIPTGLERSGWFDDTCDGTIRVKIGTHSATARFSSGPPDFVPQSHHVRSGIDEFDQMLHGPSLPTELPATAEARQQHIETVIRIIRSALETMRHMNTRWLNEDWTTSAFNNVRVEPSRVIATHGFYLGMARQLATNDPARFARAQAELERLGDQLRDYLDGADTSPAMERKMPTMMRGTDGSNLCLTRRQQEYLRRVGDLSPPS